MPINTTPDIYRYSEAMLKHLPDDVLETFQHELLYSKKKVIIKGNAVNSFNDRKNHIAAAARNNHTDGNIEDRIAKFNDDNALSVTKVYRIPLRYLVDIGLVNFPTAFNTKFTFNLEQKEISYLKAEIGLQIFQEELLNPCRLDNLMLIFYFMERLTYNMSK